MKRSIILSLIFICHFANGFTQPGSLDVSFAKNGLGIYTFNQPRTNAYHNFSLLQPDGKLIMVGTMGDILSLVRIKTNGAIDSSFGTDGKILETHEDADISISTGVLQADGKIVVCGTISVGSKFQLYIRRFNTNGTPDKTFNGSGRLVTSFGGDYDAPVSSTIQKDGKIIIAGVSYGADIASNYGIVRLKKNGAIDTDFGDEGVKNFSFEGYATNVCNSVLLQPDGKLIMVGYCRNEFGSDFSAARLNSDGTFDNSFSSDGKFVVSVVSSNDDAISVALQANGKILLCGSALTGGHEVAFAAVRLNADGMLDANFDGDGIFILNISPNLNCEVDAVAVQADKKILLAGRTSTDNGDDYGIIRLKPDGSLDNSFDGDGVELISVQKDDHPISLNLFNDKIILSGYSISYDAGFAKINTQPIPNYIIRYSCIRLNENGSLDNSFNNTGKLIVKVGSLNDESANSILGTDGKIIICGNSLRHFGSPIASVLRTDANGILDAAFNNSGKELFDQGSDRIFNSVGVRTNGKIVLAGSVESSNSDFLIGQLKQDGTVDSSFGTNGFTRIDISGNDTAAALAIQSDGKIILAGCSGAVFNRTNITVIRLTSSGLPDITFDGDGMKSIPIGLYSSKANCLAIQPDGKILIGCFSSPSLLSGKDFTVIRLKPDGSFDNTFDGDGKAYIAVSNLDDICYSMKIQDDEKIILAGSTGSGQNNDFAVVRLKVNGALDNTFDGDGKKIISLGFNSDVATSVAIQSNGKIVVAGYTYNGNDNDAAIVRINANGSLDNSFDADGIAIFNYPGTDEVINGINIQLDGKIVITGSQRPLNEAYSNTYFVMRLFGDPDLFTSIQKEKPNTIQASLKQNFPNPFTNNTTIGYSLPLKFSTAKIIITDKSGKVLKQLNITGTDKGTRTIDASLFPSGIYEYSLFINGRLIDTKQMVLVK